MLFIKRSHKRPNLANLAFSLSILKEPLGMWSFCDLCAMQLIYDSHFNNTALSQLSESEEDLKQVRVTIFCMRCLGYCNTATCAIHRRSRGLGTLKPRQP